MRKINDEAENIKNLKKPAGAERPAGGISSDTLKGKKRGRPRDSADVWTTEHIAEVADKLWAYIERTACPSLPEFCYKNGIRRQRLYEFPELSEIRYYLHEKREAYYEKAGRTLTRDDGPRGAFINKALSNLGEFSWTDKSEFAGRVATTSPAADLSPADRAKWLEENGWARR